MVSALLRQPGGFEGFGSVAVCEPLVASDSSLPERDHDPVVDLNICAACSSAHVMPPVDQDLVGPGIHELEINGEPLERVGDLDVEVPCGLATADRIYLRPRRRWDDLAVRITGREPRSAVAPIKGLVRLAESLHVLLRHRPRSIPRWGKGRLRGLTRAKDRQSPSRTSIPDRREVR
jgi:hypothetical protein